MRVYLCSKELQPLNSVYLGFDLERGTRKELEDKFRYKLDWLESMIIKDNEKELLSHYKYQGIVPYSDYEYELLYRCRYKNLKYVKMHLGLTVFYPELGVSIWNETLTTTYLPNKNGKLVLLNSQESADVCGVKYNHDLPNLISRREPRRLKELHEIDWNNVKHPFS